MTEGDWGKLRPASKAASAFACCAAVVVAAMTNRAAPRSTGSVESTSAKSITAIALISIEAARAQGEARRDGFMQQVTAPSSALALCHRGEVPEASCCA